MTSPRLEKDTFDVVVSGAGPVGLASALEAIKAGKKVAIISDRDIDLDNTLTSEDDRMFFSRGQRIFLDEESRFYLLGLFPNEFKPNGELDDPDNKFFRELSTNITIQVKDIERFLFRRIRDEVRNNPAKVEFIPNSQVKEAFLDAGTLTVEGSKKNKEAQERTISFTDMIGADGARHHSVDSLKGLPQNKTIKYEKIASPLYPYHASIEVNIKRVDGAPITLPNQFIEVATKVNGKEYVSGLSLNKSKNSNTVKCVFGGEVPKKLFDEIKRMDESNEKEVKDHVKAHMKLVLAKELGMDPKDFDVDFRETKSLRDNKEANNKEKYNAFQQSKSKLALQAFETQLSRADKACIDFNKGKFFLAGDAYRTPNYQSGHGLNHGFKHAQFIGATLRDGMTLEQYNQHCKNLSRGIEFRNIGTQLLGKKINDKFLLSGSNFRPDQVRTKFSKLVAYGKETIDKDDQFCKSGSQDKASYLAALTEWLQGSPPPSLDEKKNLATYIFEKEQHLLSKEQASFHLISKYSNDTTSMAVAQGLLVKGASKEEKKGFLFSKKVLLLRPNAKSAYHDNASNDAGSRKASISKP